MTEMPNGHYDHSSDSSCVGRIVGKNMVDDITDSAFPVESEKTALADTSLSRLGVLI